MPLSFSQSLGDVAKKEKDRRKGLKGETKVVDDWELTQAKGESMSVMGAEPSSHEGESRSRSKSSGPQELSYSGTSESSPRPDAKEMRRRREAYNKRVASAQSSLKSARAAEKTCRQARRRPSSVYLSGSCKGAADRVRSAQESLRLTISQRP